VNLVNLLIGILAVNSLVELLRHAHFLAEVRLFVETTPWWWCRMLRCGFCSSYHAALWAVAGPLILYETFPNPLTKILYWLIVSVALARAAQLLNDLTHGYQRFPKVEP